MVHERTAPRAGGADDDPGPPRLPALVCCITARDGESPCGAGVLALDGDDLRAVVHGKVVAPLVALEVVDDVRGGWVVLGGGGHEPAGEGGEAGRR
jgi:hypothetical protein